MLEDNIRRGCRVVVNDDHFRGLGGIFEQSARDADRVVILLKSINYQAKVTVEKDFVQRERPEAHAAGAERVKPAHLHDGAYKVQGQQASGAGPRALPGAVNTVEFAVTEVCRRRHRTATFFEPVRTLKGTTTARRQ